MPSELDLLTPNSIAIIFDPWVVCIHVWLLDMESTALKAQKPYCYFDVQCTWPLTIYLIKNIFVSRAIYMHDIVILRGKDNALEPGHHIASLLSNVWPLTLNSIRNIFIPWIDHMHDMLTIDGKANTLMPGKHSVYRWKDRHPDSSTPPSQTC